MVRHGTINVVRTLQSNLCKDNVPAVGAAIVITLYALAIILKQFGGKGTLTVFNNDTGYNLRQPLSGRATPPGARSGAERARPRTLAASYPVSQ